MRYLSVCSGIEAASVAWHPLGFSPVGFAEIDPFACSVLAHRFPGVTNFGDLTKYAEWEFDDAPRLVVGGTPCQSFSVAGLRKGMADPRGNLALVFLGLVDRVKPEWVVWENVPGVLSSDGGRDFGSFVGALGKLGYGFAYRILDAQFFGVPQRRRRVFVVGHRGDWRRAAAVLFDSGSLCRNPTPSRKAGKGTAYDVAPSLTSSSRGVSRTGESRGQDPVIAVAGTLGANHGNIKAEHAWTGQLLSSFHGSKISPCLKARDGKGPSSDGYGDGAPLIAIQERATCENPNAGPDGAGFRTDGIAYTIEARAVPQSVAVMTGVRRLMPVECERLQGFPDNWTFVPHRGKPAADGPRYKAIGNSMAVPCMAWIGRRIQMVDSLGDIA